MEMLTCPRCHSAIRSGDRFCSDCGLSLITQTTPASPPKPSQKWLWLSAAALGLMTCAVMLLAVILGGTLLVPRLLDRPAPSVAALAVEDDRLTNEAPATDSLVPSQTPAPSLSSPTPPAVITATLRPTPRPMGKPITGYLAPDFTLPDALLDEELTLSQYTGQPVMINFWATWCTYCEEEFPLMQTAYERHQADGLVILAVDYMESRAEVLEFASSHNLTFRFLLDPDGSINSLYRITGYPTTFFVDRQGIIRSVQVGSMTSAEINQQLALILPADGQASP